MAAGRERRANAGSRMASLMNDEESLVKDTVFKQLYGGFDDEEEDSDYQMGSGCDSDTSIDGSDADDEEEKPRTEKRKNVSKEPHHNGSTAEKLKASSKKKRGQQKAIIADEEQECILSLPGPSGLQRETAEPLDRKRKVSKELGSTSTVTVKSKASNSEMKNGAKGDKGCGSQSDDLHDDLELKAKGPPKKKAKEMELDVITDDLEVVGTGNSTPAVLPTRKRGQPTTGESSAAANNKG